MGRGGGGGGRGAGGKEGSGQTALLNQAKGAAAPAAVTRRAGHGPGLNLFSTTRPFRSLGKMPIGLFSAA